MKQLCRPAVLFLLIAGCAGGPNGDIPSGPSAANATASSKASLVNALREAGLEVRDAGFVQQPFFSVPAHVYVVDDHDLQMYEFASAAEAEAAAAEVAPDGGSIGTHAMSWMAPPHFFRKDRLVVNYLGDSQKTLDQLTRFLGPQFAGR